MTTKLPKRLLIKISGTLIILLTALIIHSCKKTSVDDALHLDNAQISKVKDWYQSTYPKVAVNPKAGKYTTFSTGSQTGQADLSQIMDPDWERNTSYNRLNTDVIEIPIDPSNKLLSSFNKGDNKHSLYKKEYSRSSFLIFKNTDGYEAYIMTIIADSAYIKGDFSKLDNNTYRRHDADFSGVVIYFTPKGKFVSSWGYKNGKIVPAIQNISSSSQNNSGLKVPVMVQEAPAECTSYY